MLEQVSRWKYWTVARKEVRTAADWPSNKWKRNIFNSLKLAIAERKSS